MSGTLPLVTVITPAYNRANYIEETIESVINQDYPNLEYIVLDDGSKDETFNVIKKYTDKLILDSHLNMGETRTVNKGFSMAKGEIIGVVNSDDPLLAGAITSIVKVMTEKPEILVVYPDWNMIDEKGNFIDKVVTQEYKYLDMLGGHLCLPGPGAFFRREVMEKLKGRDQQFRYVGDYDFWLRAGLLGPFQRIPRTLATFRVHQDSASVSQTGKLMAEEHIKLVEKIYAMPNLPQEVLAIKRLAFSSAYNAAGVSLGAGEKELQRIYFLKALSFAPVIDFPTYIIRLFKTVGFFAGFYPWSENVTKLLINPMKKLLNSSRS